MGARHDTRGLWFDAGMSRRALWVIAAVVLAVQSDAQAGRRHAKHAEATEATADADRLPECPPTQRIEGVDLDAWKAQLQAVKGWKEHNRLLAKLRVRPVWIDRQSAAFPTCDEIAALTDASVLAVDLTHSDGPDLVVQARYTLCVQGDPVALRVQVLRPLGKGAYCAMGDELSADRDVNQLPCEIGARPSRTLDFVNVTDRERQVIEIRDVLGRCGEHPQRQEALTWVDAHSGALKRIFQINTREVGASDGGEDRVIRRDVTLVGDFPKRVEVLESAHVGAKDDPGTKRAFSLRDGVYVESR